MSVLISIIIPVYNAERYLQRCVDSVLKQDYTEIEIVLVDDGSTDGCGQLCDEYAEKDKRVIVIHQENQGASIARKNGLKKAHGEYVTFVDSDDWIAEKYVSSLYQVIKKYQVRIGKCGVYRAKENEIIQIDNLNHNSQLLSFDEIMPRFFKYEFWGFWGGIYHHSVLHNITFPKATLSEDYYVMAQLFMNERQMAYTTKPLYFFEYHPNSLSHQKLSKRAFEEFENVKAVYELIKEQEPQYTDMALANVVETCIKLSLMFLHDKNNVKYQQQYIEIREFLKLHYRKIANCKNLKWKTKLVVIGLIVSPSLTALVL